MDYPVKTVGLESGDGQHYFWSLNILKELVDALDGLRFVDGTGAIQKARMVKTSWEIDRIRTAGYVTEQAIRDTFSKIRPGITTERRLQEA